MEFQGQAYEVGEQLFSVLKRAMASGPSKKETTALGKLGIDPSRWLDDAKVEDGGKIGDDPVRQITGKVDVNAVVDDVFSLARSKAIRKHLEATGQPIPALPQISDEQLAKIKKSVEDAEVTVDVDEQDRVRGLGARVKFKVDDPADGKVSGGDIELSYTLPKVGVTPDTKAPANPRSLLLLLAGLGVGGL